MAPPRGPRGGATRTSRNQAGRNVTRTSSRGGIQKRKNATKTDMDGDLDMDGEGRRAKRSAAGDTNASKPSRSTRSSTAASNRQAEALVRHLNGNPSMASRVSTSKRGSQRTPPGLAWLVVKGLKESKAASNPGGGVQDLLRFLERKASGLADRKSTKTIAIKQVSTSRPRSSGEVRMRCRWSNLA